MKTENPKFKVPPSQILLETFNVNDKPVKHVTSNKDRSKYMLYECKDGKWAVTQTATSPLQLERW